MGTNTIETAVTSIDELIALPVGVKLVDKDGDVFEKIDQDTYQAELFDFPTHYLVDYLPATVLGEPVEFRKGDTVRVVTDAFHAAKVYPGHVGEVVTSGLFSDVRFAEDGLTVPFKADEIKLIRRDIAEARKDANGIIDRIVATFRELLDKVPTAEKVEPAAEVLIASVRELNDLPDGSVVAATIETGRPVRRKQGGRWWAEGHLAPCDFTTTMLAADGKLRLVYKPTA
ncbi:hypothetical protein [Micromonospora sp. NPDC049240]|uniref:hypothetical protein n=1 Tax=Micromonospora sp. NPDC049240 TaxID=3155151 RepID=UPI0034056F2D